MKGPAFGRESRGGQPCYRRYVVEGEREFPEVDLGFRFEAMSLGNGKSLDCYVVRASFHHLGDLSPDARPRDLGTEFPGDLDVDLREVAPRWVRTASFNQSGFHQNECPLINLVISSAVEPSQ